MLLILEIVHIAGGLPTFAIVSPLIVISIDAFAQFVLENYEVFFRHIELLLVLTVDGRDDQAQCHLVVYVFQY